LREFRAKKSKGDHKAGKIPLGALCEKYAETLRHLSPSSLKAKEGILRRLKDE
jgi:hypothetical protein